MSASFVLASLRGSTYLRKSEGTPSEPGLRSLRPRWTAILSILRQSSAVVLLDRIHHGHILCHPSSRTPTGLSPNLLAYGVTLDLSQSGRWLRLLSQL